MINTYNESSLHAELKKIYAKDFQGKTETEISGYICDVVADKNIYEIQTSNISKLKNKIIDLSPDYSITVFYPIAQKTIIKKIAPSGDIISERKSPKQLTEFSIFKEITGILPLLKMGIINIELLYTTQRIIRVQTETPVQLANKSRRFKKNWFQQDKELIEITGKESIKTTEDLIQLVSRIIDIEKPFTLNTLKQTRAKQFAGLIIWVFNKLELISQTDSKQRNRKFIFKQEIIDNFKLNNSSLQNKQSEYSI